MPPKDNNMSNVDEETPFFGDSNGAGNMKGSKKSLATSWIKHYLLPAGIGLLMGIGIMSLVGKHDTQGNSDNTTTTSDLLQELQNNVNSAKDAEGTSPYKSFQGLSFQIYTGGAPAVIPDETNTTIIDNPECEGRNSFGRFGAFNELQCYLGLDDEKEDVSQRLQIMNDAVERAYEYADKDPSVLKIFIAPEFFFRGVDGAYNFDSAATGEAIAALIRGESSGSFSAEVCGPICQILLGLEEIVEQDRFKDWIFLFGTVIAAELLPSEDPFDYLFYNFAPMYKGGAPTPNLGKRFLVPKRVVSNMDFLTPERAFNHSTMELLDKGAPEHGNQATTVLNPYTNLNHFRYDNTMWSKYKSQLTNMGYTMVEYGWFKMDNITFSVEICVDHFVQSAITAYNADIVSGRKTKIPSSGAMGNNMDTSLPYHLEYTSIPTHQAQISLVSSAGMTLIKDSFALVNNGAILLQDGDYNDPPRMFYQNEFKKIGLEFEGGSEVVQRRAVSTPTELYFEYSIVDIDKGSENEKMEEEKEGTNVGFRLRYIYDNNSNNDDDHQNDDQNYVQTPMEAALEGVFSKTQYEPSMMIYDPIEIAKIL